MSQIENMSVIPESEVPVQKKSLHVPQLSEITDVLQSGLPSYFSEVQVRTVDCPDLTQEPFTLACEGLGGNARLLDVGGPPYLLPLVQRQKLYDMSYFGSLSEMPGRSFIIGAGAGPWPYYNTNCEMIANLLVESKVPTVNQTWTARVSTVDGSCIAAQVPANESRNALLGNFYCSEGLPGQVIEIECKNRIGVDDFIASIRNVLKNKYGNLPVGMGGVFVMKAGMARQHVMPDFSTVPLETDDELNNWLRFYEMSAPLVALGTLISTDPNMDLRVQHFHSFSNHGEAGHYHNDTQPENAHYLAYLGVADYIYRLDRPLVTHQVGRD
ncbi:ester hydrolase C11orf54-like [Neocloeon triangulifer]|uniref:ester hydrolase C11orf54-like n=1 Tax=Neocloeon triangulifer TaxID=2078957 RepID=UPI00286F7CC4|nr:ester hydrolase C11orf54-like [Neocloeon triangulifer]